MELLTLQRDIQGLQSQAIAWRSEKDESKREKIRMKLYNSLVELAHEVKQM